MIAAVTPELAAALDGDGRFVFPDPPAADVPWITADRARELAVGYLKGFGPSLRRWWTEDRDARIADQLEPCRRVFLAESGYEPFPAELTRSHRRAYGASWMVSFCSGTEQQVVIAVSVEATDLTIDANGIVRGSRTGDFDSHGVPVGTTIPVEPEVGAVEIASRVGPRVAALPRYRRLAARYGPSWGIWTYEMESRVRMRGEHSGVAIDTSSVDFARWASVRDLRLVMANPDSAGKSRVERVSVTDDGVTWRTVDMFRRVDVPVSLETFSIVRAP